VVEDPPAADRRLARSAGVPASSPRRRHGLCAVSWFVALTLAACDYATSLDNAPAPGVVIQGAVGHSGLACGRGTSRMLDGSRLVFEDGSGVDIGEVVLDGACRKVPRIYAGAYVATSDPAITARYSMPLPGEDLYLIRFDPGSAYGERAAPSVTQVISYEVLDAAGFRVDYDTGTDEGGTSTPGIGVVVGPRVCVGFPAPGCDPRGIWTRSPGATVGR